MLITRKEMEEMVFEAQKLIVGSTLEKTVSTQEDASLQSPGVPAHYYRYFYWLTKKVKPQLTVELGTHTGISAACLAEGYPGGQVITVNNKNQLMGQCKRPNIEYRIQDSLELFDVPKFGIDILFIDTLHDGIQPLKEWKLWSPFVRKGGIVMFDDIHLLPPMEKFWEEFNPLIGEKFELPIHGGAGFGVVLIDD